MFSFQCARNSSPSTKQIVWFLKRCRLVSPTEDDNSHVSWRSQDPRLDTSHTGTTQKLMHSLDSTDAAARGHSQRQTRRSNTTSLIARKPKRRQDVRTNTVTDEPLNEAVNKEDCFSQYLLSFCSGHVVEEKCTWHWRNIVLGDGVDIPSPSSSAKIAASGCTSGFRR